jgi:HSP20 family protein
MNTALTHAFLAPRWGGLSDELGHVFDGFLRPTTRTGDEKVVPALDVAETEVAYEVVVDLPGVANDDIEVTVHDGILTLAAATKPPVADRVADPVAEGGARVLRRERRSGSYERRLSIGVEVDEEAVSAKYRDGVLFITIPKATKALPRKIAVDVR